MAATVKPLDAVELHALTIASKKAAKQARQQLVPGPYTVDVTVRVRGTVQVAPDTDSTRLARPTPAALVAVLAERYSIDRDDLAQAVRLATSDPERTIGKEALSDAASLVDSNSPQLPITKAGAVTGQLEAQPIGRRGKIAKAHQ